jgi:hypothetical protein
MDAKTPRQVEVPRSQWIDLRHGTTVLIARKYGTSMERFKLIDVIQTADDSAVQRINASTPFAEIRLRLERISSDESALASLGGVDTLEIATDRITALYLPRSSGGGRVCFTLIGLAIDATIIVALAMSSLSLSWSGGSSF